MSDMTALQDPGVEVAEEPTTPQPLDDLDNRSGAYEDHRTNFDGESALDDMLKRVQSSATAPTEEHPQRPAAAPATDRDSRQVSVRPLMEGGYGAYVDGSLIAGGQSEAGAREAGLLAIAPQGPVERIGAAAKDVGRGMIEAPRQVVGGASEAIQETTVAIDELAGWLNTNVAGLEEARVTLPGQEPGEEIMVPSPTDLIRSVMPDIKEPESITGGAIRGIAQFITGFVGAGKLLKGAGLAVTGTGARVAEATVRGAATDFTVFDPSEERLSNLIQDVPELENPVTEYLAAAEGDTRFEGRLKNALEGAGLGAMADAFLMSLRGLRNARKARAEAPAPEEFADVAMAEARAKYGEVTDRDFMFIGDPSTEDLIITRPTPTGRIDEAMADVPGAEPGQVLKGALEGEGGIAINWARIDSQEDVKSVMQQMAELSREGIETAKRGKRTRAQTEAAAAQIDAFDVLLSRRKGQPLNAEESVAVRQMWTQATETLTEAARLAADNPSEANMFAFRKMLAVQDAVQREVLAVRAETARALQSWKIPAGGNVERAKAIQDLLAQTADDPNVHRELARRITVLAESGEIDALNAMAHGSVGARTHDAIVQVWINALLSGPKTHMVNMMSNTSIIYLSMMERAGAARLAKLMGDDASVQMGEATAQWFGMVEGMKDALRLSAKAEDMGTVWKALKTGQTGMGVGKIDVPRPGALGSDVWNVASDTVLGRTLDGFNVVSQLSGRALGAEDELFKSIGYRMELHSQALRQAAFDVSSGKIPPEQLKSRAADIVANPPEHIKLASVDAATYQTFTNAPGNITKAIMQYRNAAPVIGPLTATFVRTPGNIMKFTFERTVLAPLMSHVRADMAAGGARRDLALTRIAMGTTLMAISADLAMDGIITGKGPADPQLRAAQRRAGIQPYSIKVGDRWFAYNRLDPIGGLIGMSADMVDVMANGDMNDEKFAEDYERAMVGTIAAVGANSMSKSYMQGFSKFINGLSDPTRNAEYWVQGVAGSMVPTLGAEIRRMNDPYMREVRSMGDAIMNRTPGLSEDLPLRRDLWGRPIDYRSGLGMVYDAVSPIYSRKENPEPIDTELLRLGDGPSMPARRMSFEGAVINLDQYEGAYSRFLELSGNELKMLKYGDKGVKDALNDIVTGQSPFSAIYDMRTDGPDGGKMSFINSVVTEGRVAAKQQLMAEYPQITVEMTKKRGDQAKWQFQQ